MKIKKILIVVGVAIVAIIVAKKTALFAKIKGLFSKKTDEKKTE